jgi:hypothetical protein
MKVYIVRVYREYEGTGSEFVGVVEQVGSRGKSAFTTFEKLCEILNPASPKSCGEKLSENDSDEVTNDIRL